MQIQTFFLTEDHRVSLTSYIQEPSPELPLSGKRPGVLVCPGGGYSFTSDREAEPIALAYLAQGFQTFVLRYSVGPFSAYPQPLLDLCRALKYIRSRGTDWFLQEDQIAVCGFSAGGHLAASLGTLWNDPAIQTASDCLKEENRPNALILGYPVITLGEYTHAGTAANALQHCVSAEERESLRQTLSCEKQVGPHTPPAFLFHTFCDNGVPVENVLLFSTALARSNVPFELHVFQDGAHGLALANHITYATAGSLNQDVEQWLMLSVNWLWNLFGRNIPYPPYDSPTREQRARCMEELS